MLLRAYRWIDGEWQTVGEFDSRKAAIKAAGKSGAVVYDCGTRRFLSSYKPYTMERATLDALRKFPENEDLTI